MYWKRTGISESGSDTFSAAVEISCRWDRMTVVFKDQFGKERSSRSQVMVDREMEIGDYLLEATIEEYDLLSIDKKQNPKLLADAWAVSFFERVPNLRNTIIFRRAWL